MISKILEAEAIINKTTIVIVNTQMDIMINYEIEKDDIKINSIYGEFSYNTENSNYQKKTTIKFKTDNTWRITILWNNFSKRWWNEGSFDKDEFIVEFVTLNFDEKRIKIQF